jgi:fermentation-respiration switch protein FrsA (DUF1100 family)
MSRLLRLSSVAPRRGYAGVALLLCLSALALGACAEMDGFLFNTERIDRYHPPSSIPAELIEPVTIESEGNTLYGYWIRGADTGRTILYCHGNKKNMDAYWDRIEMLRELGANIFWFDYRGFGLSEGDPSEHSMYADADAALAYVRSRGFAADSIILYGFSLGNVASIHLAAERITPRALIVESAFASATSLAQGATVLDFQERWLTDGTFDNVEAIRRVTAPVLVLHGEEDDFIRYRDNGRLVFGAANEPKKLVLVPGAVHDNVPQTMGVAAYLDEIRAWIR